MKLPSGEEVTPTGVPCPRCSSQIVHNGNFFCSEWPKCQWALGEKDEAMRQKLRAR